MSGREPEDLPQAAEEVGAIARQLLHLLRQRDVEPLAEIGDLGLRFAVGGLRGVERVLDRGQLLAQRGDLLVEDVDLRERARGDLLLRVERVDGGVRLVGRRLGARAAASAALVCSRCWSFCARFERRREHGDLAFVGVLLAALHRQQARQLLDLAIEPRERAVLARHLAGEEELRQHEHREQEDDDEQHRRQGVDEAGPIIDAFDAASAPSAMRRAP